MVWAKLFGAPTTQHEADVMALRLFFVFLLLLAGLISAGMCLAKTALGTAA